MPPPDQIVRVYVLVLPDRMGVGDVTIFHNFYYKLALAVYMNIFRRQRSEIHGIS